VLNELVYNFNRVPSQKSSITPYEKVFQKKPDLNDFHEFGEEVYVHIPESKRKKLDNKAKLMKYLGHDPNVKGYRVYDPERRSIYISRDLVFMSNKNSSTPVINNKLPTVQANTEKEPFSDGISLDDLSNSIPKVHNHIQVNPVNPVNPVINEQLVHNNPVEQEPIPVIHVNPDQVIQVEQDHVIQAEPEERQLPRRSTRSNFGIPPSRYQAGKVYHDDPKTYKQAISSPDKDKWIIAMNQEIQSLKDHNTWELASLPPGKNVVGSKWVFKKKSSESGEVQYKARLVAQGYSQKFGEDYDEVFAPVTRAESFRLLLNQAALRNHHVRQFDIKSAFLNGNLDKEIYMAQPVGFASGNQVCKLKKSIYGLKQAAKSWNDAFDLVLKSADFSQSVNDPCLYSKNSSNPDKLIFLIIHVDDMLISSKSEQEINNTRNLIGKHFKIKDLGEVRTFLNIKVEKDSKGDYFLSQQDYIQKIVEEGKLIDAKPSRIPLDEAYYKIKCDEILPNNHEYIHLIGKLLYLSLGTRPDISAAVAILSQKSSKPNRLDLHEVRRVIKYVQATSDFKLRISNKDKPAKLEIYSDANWAEDETDRKSNSGYISFFAGGTLTWSCKKQNCLAGSSTDAEYYALYEASMEVLWLRKLCKDFQYSSNEPVIVKADNQSSLKRLDNDKFSNGSKHIDVKFHGTRYLKKEGIINPVYCPTEFNIADMLTKPLGHIKLKLFRELAGVTSSKETG
jgi:hypothetical protein